MAITVCFLIKLAGQYIKNLNDSIEDIAKKYEEMNFDHPFKESKGRSTRIWLDLILKNNLHTCTDWSKISKREYL